MHAEPSSGAAVIIVARGGSCRFHGRAADRLHIGGGALRLFGPPDWLAENLVVAGRILAPGEYHVLERDGWYEAQALATTRIRIEAAEKPLARLRRLVLALCGKPAGAGS